MNGYQVILGLGKTGLSFLKFCLREKLSFAVTDSRENPPHRDDFLSLAPSAPYSFGHLDAPLILNAERLMISPGISIKEPVIQSALQKNIPYLGDIELFLQHIQAPVIAITGANAKSTVTALVGEMAKNSGYHVKVAGNIGVPVLDLLEEPQADLYVLELSSFQLETTFSLKAKAASILNISEDHMDRYKTMQEYLEAKLRIYPHCHTAVVNRADPRLWPKEKIQRITFFGLSETADGYGIKTKDKETYLTRHGKILMKASEMKIRGRHNIENALAALALAEAAGLDESISLHTLQTFPGLPHRCQWIGEKNKISWYNDSKGTNVGATLAALEGLGTHKNIVLIAGGRGKGADFTLLRDAVQKYVHSIILIGEAALELAHVLNGCCEITLAHSMEEAVLYAHRTAKTNDIVLLSPACSSLDMFENYEHRGKIFESCIKKIEELQ